MYTSKEALSWEGVRDIVDSIEVRIKEPPGWRAQSRSVGFSDEEDGVIVESVEEGIDERREL